MLLAVGRLFDNLSFLSSSCAVLCLLLRVLLFTDLSLLLVTPAMDTDASSSSDELALWPRLLPLRRFLLFDADGRVLCSFCYLTSLVTVGLYLEDD